MNWNELDRMMMERAIALASLTKDHTRPNPCVGCVIVGKGANILGEGWHRRPGLPHAEIEALRDADARSHEVYGGHAYVTLEPCNHHGRTGPCTEALIEAGISKVTIALADPNQVASGGIARMRAAGIEVRMGLMAEEAFDLNPGFFISHSLKRPLVTMKYAMTADGCSSMHNGHSHWVTGEHARKYVHRRRAAHDAVLAGIGTVLHDDARLTVRLPSDDKSPRLPLSRIALDSDLRLPIDAPFLESSPDSPAIVVCSETASPEREKALIEAGAEVVRLPKGPYGISINDLLAWLHSRKMQSLYLEGGRTVSGVFLQSGLIDRVESWIAPKLAGGAPSPHLGPVAQPDPAPDMSQLTRLQQVRMEPIGGDFLLTGWLSPVREMLIAKLSKEQE